MATAPESDSSSALPALALVVRPVSVTRVLLDDFASACDPPPGPDGWRAGGAPLEAVQKIVTANVCCWQCADVPAPRQPGAALCRRAPTP